MARVAGSLRVRPPGLDRGATAMSDPSATLSAPGVAVSEPPTAEAAAAPPAVPSELVDETVQAVAARVEEERLPRATYRVQFNREFTFRQATALVPYWSALGISDVYAS